MRRVTYRMGPPSQPQQLRQLPHLCVAAGGIPYEARGGSGTGKQHVRAGAGCPVALDMRCWHTSTCCAYQYAPISITLSSVFAARSAHLACPALLAQVVSPQ